MSGVGRKKWVRAKSSAAACEQYLEAVKTGDLKDKVFYRYYTNTGTGAFEHLTALAIAQAIHLYRQKHNLGDDYKASITIDGLKGSEGPRIGRQLRESGIKPRKVRGARDESEPIVRLADRLAGLVRDAESDGQRYKTVQRQLEQQGVITKLYIKKNHRTFRQRVEHLALSSATR